MHKSRQQEESPFPYPIRRALLQPARIVDRLGLAEPVHDLELGPGAECFSVEIARRLGQARKLAAFRACATR